MKEFVDEFYSVMSAKISSMKKEHKREIRDIKNKMKTATSASRSVKLFKQSKEYIVNSNVTISSWASEKQYELHKQLCQLVSESRSQLQQWDSSDIPQRQSLQVAWSMKNLCIKSREPRQSIVECVLLEIPWIRNIIYVMIFIYTWSHLMIASYKLIFHIWLRNRLTSTLFLWKIYDILKTKTFNFKKMIGKRFPS